LRKTAAIHSFIHSGCLHILVFIHGVTRGADR
jgi:hypothetical protein